MKTTLLLDHFLSLPQREHKTTLESLTDDELLSLIDEISKYTSDKIGECARHGANDERDPEFFDYSCPSIIKAEIAESHQLWEKTNRVVQERFGTHNTENASNQYLSGIFEKLRTRGILQASQD